MPRVTPEEVTALMDDLGLSEATLNAFITGASTMVNNVLIGVNHTEELLKEIERWTAAHLISCGPGRQAKKEGAGGANIEYVGEFGEGFHATTYGQMVLTLDTSGRFAALGQKQVVFYAVPSKKY